MDRIFKDDGGDESEIASMVYARFDGPFPSTSQDSAVSSRETKDTMDPTLLVM